LVNLIKKNVSTSEYILQIYNTAKKSNILE